jgi:hypothetical protein
MKLHLGAARFATMIAFTLWGVGLGPPAATAQPKFEIKTIAEKKVKDLPSGPLYWRLETFPTLKEAQAAAGATSLAADVAGKSWLLTLGPAGGSTPGASKLAEIGPLPPVKASEYLLRLNHSGGPPGAKTPVHTHPGSEAFYVLTGKLTQRTPAGVEQVETGQSIAGHGGADAPMEVSSSGTSDLNALVLFLVDASKPFSTPAKMK